MRCCLSRRRRLPASFHPADIRTGIPAESRSLLIPGRGAAGRNLRRFPLATCANAERFIEEVRGDDPELASYLRIEERQLEAGGLN
jgi:hypothetical protein